MTLQNRVTPEGEIIADPSRGTLMGNRGCMHGPDRTLGPARWRTRAWIACRLAFRERRREVMAPGHYTELFFLDEATAYAAGHRPCAECRRAEYRAFAALWAARFGAAKASGMDAQLHDARLEARDKRVFVAEAAGLPQGTIIRTAGAPRLLLGETSLRWTPSGYDRPLPRPQGRVTVLTPAPVVALLSDGLAVALHPSAEI